MPDAITALKYDVVVVDVETSGLDCHRDIPLSVAWWSLRTGERDYFVPQHDVRWVLNHGDPKALTINRYREEIMQRPQDADRSHARRLEAQLHDNTILGSNPAFDARFLEQLIEPVWHHRFWDLGAYAAGRLNLDYVPGLADVCTRLAVSTPDHTAEGDVTAAGACFLRLREL